MTEEIKFTLLENGLDFIDSALEQMQGKPTPRQLKIGLIHIAAGTELILKRRLEIVHWSLVFDKPDRANKEHYTKGDFKSVSLTQLPQRLKDILELEFDKDRICKIASLCKRRNQLMHFGFNESAVSILAVSTDAAAFAIRFIEKHLPPDELSQPVVNLLSSIRVKVADNVSYIEKRMALLKPELNELAYVLPCPSCYQNALEVLDEGMGVQCHYCSFIAQPKEAVEEFVTTVLKTSWRDVIRGAEWPYNQCPECMADTLIDCNNSLEVSEICGFVCFTCGSYWQNDDLERCCRCGEYMVVDEDSSSACYKCYREYMDKDD